MEGIIWIIIIILIIHKILAGRGANTRFPGPVERIPDGQGQGPVEEDKPLSGPWNRPSDSREGQLEYNDVPLPGPWNRVPEEETPETGDGGSSGVPGRFSGDRDGGKSKAEQEMVRLEENKKEHVPVPGYRKPEKSGRQRDKKPVCETAKSTPPQAVPSFYRLLNSRHGLAASVVMNEILGKRGGRRRYYH